MQLGEAALPLQVGTHSDGRAALGHYLTIQRDRRFEADQVARQAGALVGHGAGRLRCPGLFDLGRFNALLPLGQALHLGLADADTGAVPGLSPDLRGMSSRIRIWLTRGSRGLSSVDCMQRLLKLYYRICTTRPWQIDSCKKHKILF